MTIGGHLGSKKCEWRRNWLLDYFIVNDAYILYRGGSFEFFNGSDIGGSEEHVFILL